MDLIEVIQVQTSVPRKRPRSANDLKLRDLRWLMEVHKKIWKQEGLESELFRKVEVTQEDYVELQKRLKELHPDHDSPDYDGSKPGLDVLVVKLDFLRSLKPTKASSPLHPDDNDHRVHDDGDLEARNKGSDSELSNKCDDSEAINDDDDSDPRNEDEIALESLFPFILNFLDLSTLGLNVTPLPLSFLHRQEYEDISKLIEDRTEGYGGSVLISGQPGIG